MPASPAVPEGPAGRPRDLEAPLADPGAFISFRTGGPGAGPPKAAPGRCAGPGRSCGSAARAAAGSASLGRGRGYRPAGTGAASYHRTSGVRHHDRRRWTGRPARSSTWSGCAPVTGYRRPSASCSATLVRSRTIPQSPTPRPGTGTFPRSPAWAAAHDVEPVFLPDVFIAANGSSPSSPRQRYYRAQLHRPPHPRRPGDAITRYLRWSQCPRPAQTRLRRPLGLIRTWYHITRTRLLDAA